VGGHNQSLQRAWKLGTHVDIGYFLKLMVDKGASDMFLTTGAPVNIKVEGKLYPLAIPACPVGWSKRSPIP
jgi:twitching motility protein PilU